MTKIHDDKTFDFKKNNVLKQHKKIISTIAKNIISRVAPDI